MPSEHEVRHLAHMTDTEDQKEKQGVKPLMRMAASSKIIDLLNSGALAPGRVVSQRELVEMTGATLSAIREAVPRLEAEGLLTTLPKRGLMVPSLDVAFVRDAYRLRRMIELDALSDALANLPSRQFGEWVSLHESLLVQLGSGAREEAAEDVQKLDWAMHETLVGAMRNTLIESVYRTTAVKIRMVVQSVIQVTPFNARRVVKEHLAFLVPLQQGDIETARSALRRHINNSLTLALGGEVEDPQ